MTWRRVLLLGLLLSAASVPAWAQMKDYKGYVDPELLSRMPNFYLVDVRSFDEKQFDFHEFRVRPRPPQERVEGRLRHYAYTFDRAAGARVSPLQIMRNYQAAVAKLGGTTVYEDVVRTTLRLRKDGKETWIEVAPVNGGMNYHLYIVEREAMKQDVVGSAEALQGGLTTSGHVEVPGILFDTAKADLKPESEAAIGEVVTLLQANAALRIWVVGHTDNVGSAEANVTLSNARAASVVKALLQKGIDARRLAPHGVGPYAPVASNATEEGRAKNRRVELVAQ